MGNMIILDSELMKILKDKKDFKLFREICKKKDALRFHNWKVTTIEKIKTAVDGDEQKLKALKEMLQCLCEKDRLDSSTIDIAGYGGRILAVAVPFVLCMMQIYNSFAEKLADIQENASVNARQVMSFAMDNFQYSIKMIGCILLVFLVVIWLLDRAQISLNHRCIMVKLYNKELLDIVESIDTCNQ